jgi:hypothetical protein
MALVLTTDAQSDRTPFSKGLVGVAAWLSPSAEADNNARKIERPGVATRERKSTSLDQVHVA